MSVFGVKDYNCCLGWWGFIWYDVPCPALPCSARASSVHSWLLVVAASQCSGWLAVTGLDELEQLTIHNSLLFCTYLGDVSIFNFIYLFFFSPLFSNFAYIFYPLSLKIILFDLQVNILIFKTNDMKYYKLWSSHTI